LITQFQKKNVVVSKDSTSSNEDNNPFSIETQNNKELSTSFSNAYSKWYTHLHQLKSEMWVQGVIIEEA